MYAAAAVVVVAALVGGQNDRYAPPVDRSRWSWAAWVVYAGATTQTIPEHWAVPCQKDQPLSTGAIPVLLPGTSLARLRIPQQSSLTRPEKRPDNSVLAVSNMHFFRRLCRGN